MSPAIKKIADNMDKRNTYARCMERHNESMKHEFFLEAIMIDYAMLEDRLSALLVCLKIAIETEDGLLMSPLISPEATALLGMRSKTIAELGLDPETVQLYGGDPERLVAKLNNITTGKLDLIKNIHKISDSKLSRIPDDTSRLYIVAAKNTLIALNEKYQLRALLVSIREWCAVRNEYVHALLNKNYKSLMKEIGTRAKQGKDYAREVDKAVQLVRRRHSKTPE